jgi:hypothetical protein
MTRSQFILGIALLCVSGTLAFFISFREREIKHNLAADEASSTRPPVQASHRSEHSSSLPLSKRKIEEIDPTNYEVTVTNLDLQGVGKKIERESRVRLREMTGRYQLTANQRREIFPLLVSHHADFQEGLIVNGFVARNPGATKLAGQIYPVLDSIQQEAYQEELLADNEWWGDIIGQLREELDGALESGEVEVVTESVPTLPTSKKPARSDGEAVENEGIDLENFFGD